MSTVVASFLGCLLLFAAIGMASLRDKQATTEDYLVASRSVSGWLTALSSAATNNSGFMFIGLLGFTYRCGVQAAWLQGGWVLGDLLVWLFVHRRVRERSGELRVSSVPQLLGARNDGTLSRPIVLASGSLTLVFLSGYAAAQLKAGSAALTGMFGWHEAAGIVLGGGIVVAYCFSGGLRASIWTDAAQALVMLASLTVLLAYSALEVGGPSALFTALKARDPALVELVPADLRFGLVPYLLGFVCGGLGVLGQPHILVRTMAIRSSAEIARARMVYFLWYVPFSCAAVAVGLYGRVLLPNLLHAVPAEQAEIAAEQTLPALARLVLPEVWLGTLLAGVFAATMSTADSQLLACSAAVTQDIAPRHRASYAAGKAATLAMAVLAVGIALFAEEGVFELVLGAWSALGAALGPLLVVRLAGLPLGEGQALAMMAAGLCAELAWTRASLSSDAFELLPGFVAPACLYGLLALLGRVRRVAPR